MRFFSSAISILGHQEKYRVFWVKFSNEHCPNKRLGSYLSIPIPSLIYVHPVIQDPKVISLDLSVFINIILWSKTTKKYTFFLYLTSES